MWSQFDQSLAVINLSDEGTKARPAMLALSRKAKGAVAGDIALGRRLFHSAGDQRISADGRACASCHPDGRDDSLTWATPDGPRNTPMLAGRLGHTAPFGWNGTADTVDGHLHLTFQRLRGRGLESHEVAALEAFINTMRTPTVHVPTVGPEAERVARGKAVFESAETACATCHTAGGAVDGAGHDVGSKARADHDPQFDTPSLRFVSGTTPYFHDGRYRTLRELLVGSDGKMGHTAHLSPGSRGARGVHEDAVKRAASPLAAIVLACASATAAPAARPALGDIPEAAIPAARPGPATRLDRGGLVGGRSPRQRGTEQPACPRRRTTDLRGKRAPAPAPAASTQAAITGEKPENVCVSVLVNGRDAFRSSSMFLESYEGVMPVRIESVKEAGDRATLSIVDAFGSIRRRWARRRSVASRCRSAGWRPGRSARPSTRSAARMSSTSSFPPG